MPTKRHVRKPARPIAKQKSGLIAGFTGHFKRFFLSFTPKNFRAYWLSKAGLIRLAKVAGVGLLFIVLIFLWYAKDLPSPSKINSKLGLTTTFYARDELDNPGHGTKLYEVHNDENRLVIDFDAMPANVKNATVAIEDRNFYKEGAFSVIGTLRAVLTDVVHRGAYQGGSTITQCNTGHSQQHAYFLYYLLFNPETNYFDAIPNCNTFTLEKWCCTLMSCIWTFVVVTCR